MLLALSYHVLPELREHFAEIMWAYHVRAAFAAIGLLMAYGLLRFRFYPLQPPDQQPSQRLRTARSVGYCLILGCIPALLLWHLIERLAGGYFFWETWQDGAEREAILAALGLVGWSLILGVLIVSLRGGRKASDLDGPRHTGTGER